MRTKQILMLLPVFAVCASPAFANYFSNPRIGMNLNVGSAPNPKPARLPQSFTVVETTSVTPAVPVPAAAPLVAPIQRPVELFMVFFDFDKSNLSGDMRQIVSKAVTAAQRNGSVRIIVTGHTDTVGSYSYNQALSERRALAVKSEMVRLGVRDAEIVTVGRSFSDPLIATGPGVREPQNRRAVIDISNPAVAELD